MTTTSKRGVSEPIKNRPGGKAAPGQFTSKNSDYFFLRAALAFFAFFAFFAMVHPRWIVDSQPEYVKRFAETLRASARLSAPGVAVSGDARGKCQA